MSIKTKKTRKLFYKKYLYSIKVYNTGFYFWYLLRNLDPSIFHEDNIFKDQACKNIRVIHKFYGISHLKIDDYKILKQMSDMLYKHKEDIRFSILYNGFLVYTNDMNIVNEFKNTFNTCKHEISLPENTVIDDIKKGKFMATSAYKNYKYQATINYMADPSFPDWIEKNNALFSITDYTKSRLRDNMTVTRFCIYVKSEKALTLLGLKVNKSNIQDIYELTFE